MQIGALGDIHGEFDTVRLIMQRHADVTLWVSVGDVASNDGEYFTPDAPLYFIKGNNEDFDVLAAAIGGQPPAPTLHYMRNGGPHLVGPWRVAALCLTPRHRLENSNHETHETHETEVPTILFRVFRVFRGFRNSCFVPFVVFVFVVFVVCFAYFVVLLNVVSFQ